MSHGHHERSLGRRCSSAAIDAVMLALQIVGGVAANSLGLLSDAAHNGSDVGAWAWPTEPIASGSARGTNA